MVVHLMELKINVFIAILFILLIACSSKSDINKKFVLKYGKENFDEFRNTAFLIRSSDYNGGIIIFAYDYRLNPNSDTIRPYIITVDEKSSQIKNISCHLMKDSTKVDRKGLEKLEFRFRKYPIQSLYVDSNNNVLINLKYGDRPNLIKFSELKFKSNRYDGWEQIKDNWYQKVE